MNEQQALDALRPVLARVVSALVAAGAAALARHGLEIQLDETTRGTLSDVGVALILGVWGIAYAALHRLLSVWLNPTDAASPSLAKTASGKTGRGERTSLGESWDAAAKGTSEQPVPVAATKTTWADTPPRPVQPELAQRPPDFRPPAYEPLYDVKQTPEEVRAILAPVVEPPAAPKSKRQRKPKVTVQQPGAPQPPSDPQERPAGFEP